MKHETHGRGGWSGFIRYIITPASFAYVCWYLGGRESLQVMCLSVAYTLYVSGWDRDDRRIEENNR